MYYKYIIIIVKAHHTQGKECVAEKLKTFQYFFFRYKLSCHNHVNI
jgi:hypothetical protein